MSCFILPKANIDAAVRLVAMMLLRPLNTRQDRDAYGTRLIELNAKAYNHVYAKKGFIPTPSLPYTYTPPALSDVELLKAANCVLWNTDEGDLRNDPLFKDVETACRLMETRIVNNLPAYQNAKWSLEE